MEEIAKFKKDEDRSGRVIKALLEKRGLSRSEAISQATRTWWIGGAVTAIASAAGIYAFTIQDWRLLAMSFAVGAAMSYALRSADHAVQLIRIIESAGETLNEVEQRLRLAESRVPPKERESIRQMLVDASDGEKEKEEGIIPRSLSELFTD